MRRRRQHGLPVLQWWLGVVVVLVSAYLLVPLVITVLAAFSSGQYLEFPPRGFSLRWFERFFSNPDWMNAAKVSLQVALLSTTMTLVLGYPAARSLTRGRYRGKLVFHASMMAPLILPVIITGAAEYFFFARVGLLDSVLGLALGHTVIGLPVMVLMIMASLRNFPFELEEAAYGLGASRVQTLRRVTLPNVAPGVMAGCIFTFMTSLDDLIVPLFVSGPHTQTVPVRIWNSLLLQVEPTVAAISTTIIALVAISLLVVALLLRQNGRRTARVRASR